MAAILAAERFSSVATSPYDLRATTQALAMAFNVAAECSELSSSSLSRSLVTSSTCASALKTRRSSGDFRGVPSLIAVATYVTGPESCFSVNVSLLAPFTVSVGCTRESRFSGKLDSLDPLAKRFVGPSTGLTAPDDDPPLLAARNPLLTETELDCLE